MSYDKHVWDDNAGPPFLRAVELNEMEDGIEGAHILAEAAQSDFDAHAALKTGVHGIPAMSNGEGLLWNGTAWVATNLATQAELDSHAAAQTGIHGIPSMSNGQGLLWNGTTWVATNLATQAELDAEVAALDAVDAALGAVDDEHAALWKSVLAEHGVLPGGTPTVTGSLASGSLLGLGGTTGSVVAWDYAAADYALSGKTTRLRLTAILNTNNTAAGVNVTFALHRVTAVTGAPNLAYTTAAAVTGSTVTFTAPAANSILRASATFDAPGTDGEYILIVTTSGTSAANSRVGLFNRLEYAHA